MRALVFSDPHGRLPLLLRIVWEHQRRSGVAADLILVAGDLGIWPEPAAVDSSTRRCARADPGELGFLHFAPVGTGPRALREPDEVEDLVRAFCLEQEIDPRPHLKQMRRERVLLDRILPDLDRPLLFVGGTHEDYDYLLRCRAAAPGRPACPVEASGRIAWISSGLADTAGLRVAGLSGLDAAAAGRSPARYHGAVEIDDDRTLAFLERTAPEPVDVFLSHDGPPDFPKDGKGSERIRLAVSELEPVLHIFGHYHANRAPVLYRELFPDMAACPTRAVHLNKLVFQPHGALRDRAVGLISRVDGAVTFAHLTAPWLESVTAQSWLRL